MPPRRLQPNSAVKRLLDRRDKLETLFFDLLEVNKVRYAAWNEIEQDDEITERTRERRLAAIDNKIAVTEDRMSVYKDEIEEINATLVERGYGVEPFDR
ncbi:hypothetical protein C7212DRAFT_366096, partial [Tuber magnatum]